MADLCRQHRPKMSGPRDRPGPRPYCPICGSTSQRHWAGYPGAAPKEHRP